LIDVTIFNNEAEIVNITEYTAKLKERGVLKTHADKQIGDYIERSKVRQVFSALELKDPNRPKEAVTLYFLNQKCLITEQVVEDAPSFPMFGGLSPTGTGIAYMIVDEHRLFPAENIAHEVLHALGLPHSFKEADNKNKEHTFKKGRTANYMDYGNRKRQLWKWQWELLHQSKFLK
jgi:hypothetical protein